MRNLACFVLSVFNYFVHCRSRTKKVRIVHWSFFLLLIGTVPFPQFTPVTAQGLDTTSYFPLNLGDTYHYYQSLPCPPSLSQPTFSVGFIVIKDTITIGGRRYYYVPGLYYGDDTVGVDSKGDLMYHYRGVDGIFYKFNASVGDTWQVALPFVNGVPDTFVVTMQSRNDTVRVHAGTFTNCLRIFFDHPGSIDGEFWHWLAPGVGLVFHCVQEPRELYEATVGGVHYPGTNGVHTDLCPANSFALNNSFPNPFNPATTIQYSLPSTQYVSLKIYDVLGRELTTLFGGTRQPGTYTVRWDAGGFSSGVYFYRLKAGNYVETKKMILLH
jgi:hypothetical protein